MLTLSEERKFHLIFAQWSERSSLQGTKVPGNESSREQKYQGAKVPFAPGSESTWERKF